MPVGDKGFSEAGMADQRRLLVELEMGHREGGLDGAGIGGQQDCAFGEEDEAAGAGDRSFQAKRPSNRDDGRAERHGGWVHPGRSGDFWLL
jgi:hypothetical protein